MPLNLLDYLPDEEELRKQASIAQKISNHEQVKKRKETEFREEIAAINEHLAFVRRALPYSLKHHTNELAFLLKNDESPSVLAERFLKLRKKYNKFLNAVKANGNPLGTRISNTVPKIRWFVEKDMPSVLDLRKDAGLSDKGEESFIQEIRGGISDIMTQIMDWFDDEDNEKVSLMTSREDDPMDETVEGKMKVRVSVDEHKEITGFFAFYEIENGYHGRCLLVDPGNKNWGIPSQQRKKIGKTMVDDLKARLRPGQKEKIVIEIDTNNIEGMRFLASQGFVLEKKSSRYTSHSNKRQIRMIYDLNTQERTDFENFMSSIMRDKTVS